MPDLSRELLSRLEAMARNDTTGNPRLRSLREITRKLIQNGIPNLAPLLPALFNLKGKPYTLDRHFPFEPLFKTHMPKNLVAKCGRQTSKSTSVAAQGVITAACLPHFNTLFVTPLFEMIRRFSTNYVRPFIEESPLKNLLIGDGSSQNVLQRSFANGSILYFSFAFLDTERIRGINASKVVYDEVQDLDKTFIPIIEETMSGAPEWAVQQFTGTPKTLDNTIEQLWQDSSMAEWGTKCFACGKINYASLDYDLDGMIGPWRPDISLQNPAVVCAKCKKPIYPHDPKAGRWYHRFPEKIEMFSGYHVPQIILPLHYANPDAWANLLNKREKTSVNVFYNEVCGESYDTGSKLVTLTELRNAAVLNENKIEEAKKRVDSNRYSYRILACDWGGGGVARNSGGKEKSGGMTYSYTVYAVLGICPNGKIEVIYGYRSLTPHDKEREARICLRLLSEFHCHHLVHDYNGAGAYREKYVIDAGYPIERVIPIGYVPAARQGIIKYHEPTDAHPRTRFTLDKPRSLVLTCSQIRAGNILFFQDDYKGHDNPGLLRDFLSLVEEKSDGVAGMDIYKIIKKQNSHDDFAHAVNMGACWLWYFTDSWPDTARADAYRKHADLDEAAKNLEEMYWEDLG